MQPCIHPSPLTFAQGCRRLQRKWPTRSSGVISASASFSRTLFFLSSTFRFIPMHLLSSHSSSLPGEELPGTQLVNFRYIDCLSPLQEQSGTARHRSSSTLFRVGPMVNLWWGNRRPHDMHIVLRCFLCFGANYQMSASCHAKMMNKVDTTPDKQQKSAQLQQVCWSIPVF